jgi:ABC-type glycerol-3-phosphate transport system substrate-binding protein
MSDTWKRVHPFMIDRRGFLKGTAALGGLGAASMIVAGPAKAQGESIIVWDYKNPPGSDGNNYYLAAAERFKAQSGISVGGGVKSAESIEQAVAAAANAGEGFDSLVWWSGPTARNQASLGNVIPLDDKIPPEALQAKAGLAATSWQGRVYAVPRTIGTYFLVYNRNLLDKAGVQKDVFPPANADPVKWDVFLEVCDKVKTSGGVAPLMFANKEGYFNEWYFYNFLGMGFDSSDEIAEIGAGRSTWKNDAVYRPWRPTAALRPQVLRGGRRGRCLRAARSADGRRPVCDERLFRPDRRSHRGDRRELRQGGSRLHAGAQLSRRQETLRSFSLEPDAVYVASFSEKQDAAVKWVNFLASLEEVNEMVKALQLAPADSRFDRASSLTSSWRNSSRVPPPRATSTRIRS